jgi:GMP synthase (glutamine-hydrolysing)
MNNTNSLKTAIAIRHVAFEDLGSLAEVLVERGYCIGYLEATSSNLTSLIDRQPDLLIILGGPIGVYDEEDYPFLTSEFQVLQARLAADLPTLGICLGAQLMAQALGAKVYPGGKKEIGWSPISLTAAGENTPLKHLQSSPVLHWHGDTFDLPANAIHLASSSIYPNQAFAWQRCGLALQFHPEVTAKGLEAWFVGHACEINATDAVNVSLLRRDTELYSQALVTSAKLLWHSWLEQIET